MLIGDAQNPQEKKTNSLCATFLTQSSRNVCYRFELDGENNCDLHLDN